MKLKRDPYDNKPCPHMRTLVSAYVDGALSGIRKRYTEWHVGGCKQCSGSVPFLHAMHDRLHTLDEAGAPAVLPDERWHAIEQSWQKIDG